MFAFAFLFINLQEFVYYKMLQILWIQSNPQIVPVHIILLPMFTDGIVFCLYSILERILQKAFSKSK